MPRGRTLTSRSAAGAAAQAAAAWEAPQRLLAPPDPHAFCAAEWCSGPRRKGIHFCGRCWGLLTPDERLAYMMACHAPWWPECLAIDEDAGESVVVEGEGFFASVTPGGWATVSRRDDAGRLESSEHLGVALWVLERRLGVEQARAILTWQTRSARLRRQAREEHQAERDALDGDPQERAVGRRLM